MRLELPWPHRDLHPNSRVHWSKRAKAAKSARRLAHYTALESGWKGAALPDGRLLLSLEFYPHDRRRRDDDGLISACKAYRDGLADALGIDDRRFVTRADLKDETRDGGVVVVRIEAA